MSRDVPVLSREGEVPTGCNIAYHVSPKRHQESILAHGIRPSDRGPKGSEVDWVLHKYDSEFDDVPKNRSACVFLHPTPDTPFDAAAGPSVCFVIDLSKVTNAMYTADWHALGDLYGSPDPDVERAAAESYWRSCRRFSVGDSVESEILVDGAVSPQAITHIFDPDAN